MTDQKPNRKPGALQRFADQAGGPSVFAGANYQTGIACAELLRLLVWQQQSPLAPLSVVCEPRAVRSKAQLGFDLRVVEPDQDRFDEVKASPQPAEVQELVARLDKISDGQTVRLVHGKDTVWTRALDRLVGLAHEAVTDDELTTLVDAAADDNVTTLLSGVPDTAPGRRLLLRRMDAPYWVPAALLSSLAETTARMLAGDRADQLLRLLRDRIGAASERRVDLVVSQVLDDLVGAGLVVRLDVQAPSADPNLASAIAVLDRCPVPLPEPVLAGALGLAEGGAAALLDELCRARMVLCEDNTLWRAPGPSRVSADRAMPAITRSLELLLSIPKDAHGERVGQVLNVLSLATAAREHHPGLVATAFQEYDKAVKATGDLSAVYRLSKLSLDAATAVPADGADTKALLKLRGHARICGVGWVLQRVGLPQDAARQMDQARQESEQGGSRENLAFIDKCNGRLSRLTAEDLAEAGEPAGAEEAYDLSRLQLDSGYDQFRALVVEPEFARHVEEPGECLALRARTELSQGRLDDAERYAELAHRELDHLADARKAWADTCLVDAEAALARVRDGEHEDPASVLDEQKDRLAKVLDQFWAAATPGPTVDVGASEIVGRTLMVLATVARETDGFPEAARLYEKAAGQFERVDQGRTAYRCQAQALDLTGAVPAELVAALQAAQADDGTRVEAYRLHTQTPLEADPPSWHWERLVARGQSESAARVHTWTDRQAG